jgi:hypothetical protein
MEVTGRGRRHRNAFLVEDPYATVAYWLLWQCADPGWLGNDQDEPDSGVFMAVQDAAIAALSGPMIAPKKCGRFTNSARSQLPITGDRIACRAATCHLICGSLCLQNTRPPVDHAYDP